MRASDRESTTSLDTVFNTTMMDGHYIDGAETGFRDTYGLSLAGEKCRERCMPRAILSTSGLQLSCWVGGTSSIIYNILCRSYIDVQENIMCI